MDELGLLGSLTSEELPRPPAAELDPFYRSLLDNLHLELLHDDTLYLLAPDYTVRRPNAPSARLLAFVKERRPLLDGLRSLLVRNLLAHSFLVETHSYFLEQNGLLTIARLAPADPHGERLEVRYYTNSPVDLVAAYSDKIYIGRDFVRLQRFTRPKLGLEDHLQSLVLEIEELKARAGEKLRERTSEVDDLLTEIEQLGEECREHGQRWLEPLPPGFIFEQSHDRGLLEAFMAGARQLKHYLIEMEADLDELAALLRDGGEVDFVRYVVKFQSDVRNLIALIDVKALARGLAALGTSIGC